jgi:hypothetical protein
VDWDRWPVADYLGEFYRELLPVDGAVIDHHSAVYRRLAPGSVGSSVEVGAGPNLYPLMLAAAASRRIVAVERSAANVGYLTGQLRDGPDPSWAPFYARCRREQPALPGTMAEALSRVEVVRDSVLRLAPGGHDMASMNFVAESVTEDFAEFTRFCLAFVRAVRPGGQLVAAFMENMGRYYLGEGAPWPGRPVDAGVIREVFAPYTEDLVVTRVDADPVPPPEYRHTGVVLMSARRGPNG